jgi:hypothetical protein
VRACAAWLRWVVAYVGLRSIAFSKHEIGLDKGECVSVRGIFFRGMVRDGGGILGGEDVYSILLTQTLKL